MLFVQLHAFKTIYLIVILITNVVVIMVAGSDKHQETTHQANLSPYQYQYKSTPCTSFTLLEIIQYLQCYMFARCMLIKRMEI